MRFPGVIMLREHFRCLPEIIEFSNQLAYGGKILPLREQPTDLAWQSVIDIHIPDGYRQPGTDTNPPEADYIVGKIAELRALDGEVDEGAGQDRQVLASGEPAAVAVDEGRGRPSAAVEHRLIRTCGRARPRYTRQTR